MTLLRAADRLVKEGLKVPALETVFLGQEGDTLHIYVVAADHNDAAYDLLAQIERRLAEKRPELVFEVHLRASRGRVASEVVPRGLHQVYWC